MAIYEALYVRKEVSSRLREQKAQLERTYRREISWSQFLYVLIKNGQVQHLNATDLQDDYDVVLASVGLMLEPYKLRGVGNGNKRR